MSASHVSHSQPMSEGGLNYHAPLKSVRTRRAIVVHEPPKLSFDGSEDGTKDVELKRPGISFIWENAPGKPKIEERLELTAPVELKPPPQSLPAIKVRDAAAVFSPPPAGTPPAKVNPFAGTSLPSKSSPPPSQTITMQQTTDITPSHLVVPRSSTPTRRSITPTRQSRSGDNSSPGNRDQRKPVEGERNRTVIAESRNSHHSQDRGGSHHYHLRGGLPAQKDFYVSSRNSPPTLGAKGSYALKQASSGSSRLAGRPDEDDNSEADSHSSAEWDGEHITDAGDIYSEMDRYQAQCQVSMLDGCTETDLPETSRYTDPRARDFIMQRFLPAAKAMVTESPDSDRRSPTGSLSASPRKGSRSAATGRSRFATSKQQYEADDEERESEEPGMLFKCKFPWQVSPFGSLCLPAPATQHGVSRGVKQEHGMEPAWTQEDTERSMDDNSRSFDSRGHPTNFRTRSGSSTNTDGGMLHPQREHDTSEHSQSFSVDSQSGDYYEREGSMRSNDSRRAHSSNHRESSAPATPPSRRKTEHEFAASPGSLPRTANPAETGAAKSLQQGQQPNGGESEPRKETQADTSGLNHHKYQSRQQHPPSGSVPDLRAKDIEQSQFQSGLHLSTSTSSPSLPNLSNNGGGSKYPRHLKQSLYRQDTAGSSGRSLESIDDEAWETIDRETSSSIPKNNRGDYDQHRPDRLGVVLTTANSNISDNADDARAVGWPLGKAYSAFSRVSSTDSKHDSSYSRTASTDSKHGTSYTRTVSSESKAESAYMRTASNDSKHDSFYMRTSSSDSKHEYARTPSTDSKTESFSSFSEHSAANYTQQKESDKFSPVSVLPPPLPKAPRESWLGKVMPAAPAPLSNMSNWHQAGPKKFLEHSMADDSMDVKWEALVKSENAHLRNLRLAQDPFFSTSTLGHEV